MVAYLYGRENGVALYKLIYSSTISLVVDKAIVSGSKVHGILCLVCWVICNTLGHIVAWPLEEDLQ